MIKIKMQIEETTQEQAGISPSSNEQIDYMEYCRAVFELRQKTGEEQKRNGRQVPK
ncbi:hypothetical protein KTH81_10125 [Lachnospiraceae bacterium ASD3451]|nr:hypothetical protein [Diplocloster agilis]